MRGLIQPCEFINYMGMKKLHKYIKTQASMKAIPSPVIGGFSHCMQLVDSINRYLRSFSTRKIHYI